MKSSSFSLSIALSFLPTLLSAQVAVYKGTTQPFSIVFASDGTAYGVEYEEGNRVFKLHDGKIEFIAGQKGSEGKAEKYGVSGDRGPATKGRFNGMHDLSLGDDGTLWIADTFHKRIRRIDVHSGKLNSLTQLATFAAPKNPSLTSEGQHPVEFASPYTVDLHSDQKRLLIANLKARQVQEIDLTTKAIRAVAGNGKRGHPVDGAVATETPLVAPRAAIYGKDGSIWIASREGHALRQVTPDGKIRTVVNVSGKKGYRGDGGPGAKAQLFGPKHLCLNPDGDVVISDDQNHCIRLYKVKEKTIHLLAGQPPKSGATIGKGRLDTPLNRPHGSRYDAQGRLWVCDSFNDRILCFEK